MRSGTVSSSPDRDPQGSSTPFIEVAGQTDTGRMRERNEDAYLIVDEHDWTVLAVADGVGGSPSGDVASQTAMQVLQEHLKKGIEPDELEQAFRDADSRVKNVDGGGDRAPGTTLTALTIDWPRAIVAHAGDSRAYLYRDNRLRRITRDDTVAEQMAERHVVPPGQGGEMPFEHILTNVIGGAEADLEVAISSFELQLGDQLLICSDGLTDQVSEFEVARNLHGAVTAAGACRRLLEAARRAGGEDNATVVVARVESDEDERDRRFV